jgi:CMP-2-keto-3-deoxyoctulosonic acid synthetase
MSKWNIAMNKELTFIGIIPARYASTRFPGKPLAMLGGMTILFSFFIAGI